MNIACQILSFFPYGSLSQDFPDIAGKIPSFAQKKQWIEQSIPIPLIQCFGMKRLLDAGFLEWRPEYIGWTDYIDRITEVDQSIMLGRDPSHRAFITIRSLSENDEIQTTTLFQRYSDDKGTWTYGTRHTPSWMSTYSYFCTNHRITRRGFLETLEMILSSRLV